MAEPFLSEIRLFSFNFAPKGWAMCQGQLLPINQNQALFALLGTTFGGDGRTTFALPDLRSRVPMHVGGGFNLGARPGSESVQLTQNQTRHGHGLVVSGAAGIDGDPRDGSGSKVPATTRDDAYGTPSEPVQMHPSVTSTFTGGTSSHENRQPLLALNYCIALQGIFPSPT